MSDKPYTEADVQRYAQHIAGHPDAAVDARHLAATRAILDGLDADGLMLAADTPEMFLIWSHHHDMWFAPNGRGYRSNVNDAGRYTLADTKRWLGRGCYCCQVPEVTVPVPLPGKRDSASLIKLIALVTEAEIAAGRVNQHATTGAAVNA